MRTEVTASPADAYSILLAQILDPAELVAVADAIDDAGYRRVWLAETGGFDAATVGGVIAQRTRLEVGTAIIPVYTRTPALLAMSAASWSVLGGGRPSHLGIGAGGQTIVESWHGVPFSKPATTTRETLQILRQALAGERTEVHGKMRTSRGFRLAFGAAPAVRLYVGGVGPVMVDLAAELADGLIVTWLSPRVLEGFRADLDSRIAKHGRTPEQVRLVARAYASVTDRVDEVREEVRRELVEYLVSPPYARYFASVGFERDVDEVNEAFEARDRDRAVAAVGDALLDEVLVVGSRASEVAARLADYHAAGADDVLIQPVASARAGDPLRTIVELAPHLVRAR